jgi:glycerol-3-phosphate acyltransferase PlsY
MKLPAFACTAFLVGGIPFSQLVARRHGVDLRACGSGSASAARVGQFVGVQAMLLAGSLDLAKGLALGLLARRARRRWANCLITLCCIVGHNWSPYLAGVGGRGVLPSIGLLSAQAPTGVRTISLGLLLGKCVGLTGLGCFVSYAALIPALRRNATPGAVPLGLALIVPAIVKRIMGDRPPDPELCRPAVHLSRLLLDEDQPSWMVLRVLREAWIER